MTAPSGLLENPRRRRWLFAALYLLEGAPIGFLWWALPPRLTAAGVPVDEVGGLLAALALPWALKVVWAPLVDVLRGPRWTERGWIAAAQVLMALALAPLALAGAEASWSVLVPALLVHAFAAATQDVAIDALAIRSSTPAELGRLNAWMNAGMLLGRAAFGSGALWLAPRLGERVVPASLMVLLACGTALSLCYRPRPLVSAPDAARLRAFGYRLRRLAGDAGSWRLLAFAATGAAGFEVVGGLLGPFVLDAGGSDDQLAVFYAGPGWLLPVAGGFLAGRLADRLGHVRVLVAASLAVAASVTAVALAGRVQAPPIVLLVVVVLVYAALGAFTAASYASFMEATDPELGSTQFSAFMGATNLCESWSVAAGSYLASRYDYSAGFAAVAAVGLAAVLLLPRPDSGPRHGRAGGERHNRRSSEPTARETTPRN